MHLNDQLHAIRMSDCDIIFQAIDNQLNVTVNFASKIRQPRNVLERVSTNSIKRINSSLADKIRVIIHMKKNKFNSSQVARLFRIHRRSVGNIWKDRIQLVAKKNSATCTSVK